MARRKSFPAFVVCGLGGVFLIFLSCAIWLIVETERSEARTSRLGAAGELAAPGACGGKPLPQAESGWPNIQRRMGLT